MNTTDEDYSEGYRIPVQLQYLYSAYKIQPKIVFGYDIFDSFDDNAGWQSTLGLGVN